MKKQSYLAVVFAILISMPNILANENYVPRVGLEAMNFEIPFDFNVGEKSFPAGKYKVEIDPTSSLLILTNEDDKPDQMIGEIANGKQKKNSESRLVFFKYGDEHFLREVDAPTHSSNLRKSNSEKETDKNKSKGTKIEKIVLTE